MGRAMRMTPITPTGSEAGFGTRGIQSYGGGTRASNGVNSGVSLFYNAANFFSRWVNAREARRIVEPVHAEVERRIARASQARSCISVVVMYTFHEDRMPDFATNTYRRRLVAAQVIGEGVNPQPIVDRVVRRGFVDSARWRTVREFVAFTEPGVQPVGVRAR